MTDRAAMSRDSRRMDDMKIPDKSHYDSLSEGDNGDAGLGPTTDQGSDRGLAMAPIAICLASIVIIGMASLWAAFGASPGGNGRSSRENGSTGAIMPAGISNVDNTDDAGNGSLPLADPSPDPEPMTPTALSNYASPAVVRIVGPMGTGSGFFVRKDGLLVTNCHVVTQGGPLQVFTVEGVAVSILEVVAKDPAWDLTLLRVEANAAGAWPFLELARDQAALIGTKVYALGFPLGMELTLSEGLISALKMEGGALRRIQITAAISRGSSGGPILLSDGSVVGVAVGFYTEGQNLNLAIPVGRVARLMADHAPSPQMTPPAGERPHPMDVQR